MVSAGPIAGGLWNATRGPPTAERPAIWVVSELEGDCRADRAACGRCSMSSRPRRASASSRSTSRRRASVSSFLHALVLAGRRCRAWSTRMRAAIRRAATARRAGIAANAVSTCRHPAAARRGRASVMSSTEVAGAGAAGPGPGAGRERLHRRQPDARSLGEPLGRVRHGLARAGVAARRHRAPNGSSRSICSRAAICGAPRPRAAGDGFDCVAYGAYSFEQDVERMYQTNVLFKQELIERAARARHSLLRPRGQLLGIRRPAPRRPTRASAPAPNSHYAVTKNAAAGLVYFSGKHRGLRCANLRLYSVYGPLEDRSRLIPTLVAEAAARRLPPFVEPDTSRDFIYVDDAVRAFLCAAVLLRPDRYGSLLQRRERAQDHHPRARPPREARVPASRPSPSSPRCRPALWDLTDWYANPARAAGQLGLARRGFAARRDSGARRAGTRDSPTSRSTSAPRRSARSTAFTASPSSSPATRTGRRSPSWPSASSGCSQRSTSITRSSS